MVVLVWLQQKEEQKQIISNHARKINERRFIEWKHIPTLENPADLGIQGCEGTEVKDLWKDVPSWLTFPDMWPEKMVTQASLKTEKER